MQTQLHDDVAQVILVADIVNPADVGMVKAGDRPRLPIETLPSAGIVG